MKGKIVLVTGASYGIGESIARKFASQGCCVILNARSKDRLENLKKELDSSFPSSQSLILPFDLTNRSAISSALNSLQPPWSNIDVLVNNAGLALGLDKEFEGDLNDYDVVIDTNIKGILATTRLIVPGMIKRGSGHIINIGSIAGDAAYPGGSVYCATKAAVKALTDGLRIDLVDTPLRVTNIKPGLVETHFSVVRFKGDEERAKKVYEGTQPLTGDDIAESVYFVASAPPHVQIAEMLILPTCQASVRDLAKQSPK